MIMVAAASLPHCPHLRLSLNRLAKGSDLTVLSHQDVLDGVGPGRADQPLK